MEPMYDCGECGRPVTFYSNDECVDCGKQGAFNFSGDSYCPECVRAWKKPPTVDSPSLATGYVGVKEDKRLREIQSEIYDSLQRTVKISHEESLRIVAADLLGKYKLARSRGLDSEADMLECVLRKYYLVDEEFELYT